jgi:hypothetical protein
MKPRIPLILSLLLLFASSLSASAQEEEQLSLQLSRDLGTALFGQIQGTFSMRVTGPEELVSVSFFIDGELIGEDGEAPFRLQFRTDDYEPGAHEMSAVGFTSSATELHSNVISRNFMEKGKSGQITIIIVVVVLVLSVGGRFLASRIAGRGQTRSVPPAISGPLGGTICPNCGRPYALHLWGLRVVVARLDRCPHCGKWRLVRRASPQDLEAAAQQLEESPTSDLPDRAVSEEERLRRQLDDSRFDDAN